jgi:SnoaL-like domain
MPWVPELFSAPVRERYEVGRPHELTAVPFFDGLLAGEFDALVESFAVEPQVHDPLRGRIRGVDAFAAFVDETSAWLRRRNVAVDGVDHLIRRRDGFEEVVLHLDGDTGRVSVPVAIIGSKEPDGRLDELRVYFSRWALSGSHAIRPPLLQPDPQLSESDVVAEYQRALAAGDVDAIVATFEPDGYAREPAGGEYMHRGHDGLRVFYEQLLSGGGVPLEHCCVIDDGRVCALEYNVSRWGSAELPPQAGVAVYVRGDSGRLAAARIYDDVDPPFEAVAAARLSQP